jgi:hypothetical protein
MEYKLTKNKLVVCLSSIILFATTIKRTKTEPKSVGRGKLWLKKNASNHNQILFGEIVIWLSISVLYFFTSFSLIILWSYAQFSLYVFRIILLFDIFFMEPIWILASRRALCVCLSALFIPGQTNIFVICTFLLC